MRKRATAFAATLVGVLVLTFTPSAPSAEAADYASVDAGGQHTCAVTSSNSVQCWGANDFGQLGDGSLVDRLSPVTVSGLTNVTMVTTGAWHSCALLSGGSVKCWGDNEYGQLGDGTTEERHTPVVVCASGSGGACSPLADIVAVAAGYSHVCAVTTLGAAKCWGQNVSGQLGNGTATFDANPNPLDVVGLTSGVSGIAAGRLHSCALTTAGGVKCWGNNEYGQLGDGTGVTSFTAVDASGLSSGAAMLQTGEAQNCVVMSSDGSIKCWGANTAGQLGNGTTLDATSPTDVCATGSAPSCTSTLTGTTAVAVGEAHTCALITGGGVMCWGWDGFGQLGDGAQSFDHVALNPGQVLGLSGTGNDPDIAKLDAGGGHTCVVTVNGVIKCWGWNSNGQLGNGVPGDVSSLLSADFDRDGCQDERELGTSAEVGGLRNPKSFWDFFDTPDSNNVRDKIILQADIDRVSARFGANDNDGAAPINRYTDPFSSPPPTGYHPAFDRGVQNGPYSWNRAPADGWIAISDVQAVAAQNNHSCQ